MKQSTKLIQYRRTRPKNKEPFQVNLPITQQSYKEGDGEGVWAVIVKTDNPNKVMILNDSMYYPHLKWGATFDVEIMRPLGRPVMNRRLFDYLQRIVPGDHSIPSRTFPDHLTPKKTTMHDKFVQWTY